MFRIKNTQTDQRGFASIVVALILILVLGLLTVGFAQLARREQKDTLDKQLAIQANYAAESGFNDVYQGIATGQISAATLAGYPGTLNGTYCLTDYPAHAPDPTTIGLNPTIGGNANGVSYACPLVNLTPSILTKSPLPPGANWNIVFTTLSPIDSLTIHWKNSDADTSHNILRGATDTKLPQSDIAHWQSPAVLRFSITPLGNLSFAALTRSTLINKDFTTFLYPSASGVGLASLATSNSATEGSITNADCNTTTLECVASITGLPNIANQFFIMHISGYYNTANVCVSIGIGTNCKDTSGGPNGFVGGQATIDVTGKARDVLKRVRRVVCINGLAASPGSCATEPLPDNTIEAQNVCKRQNTEPGDTTADVPSGFDTSANGTCAVN